MKEKLKKLKQNKALKIIGEILYILLFIIVILMLIVVILQRVTDNSVTIGGYRMFTVATGSMVPQYEVGDILISKEIEPSEIKVGDDIVYRGKEGSFKDKVVTHRVISIEQENGEYKIITKGIILTEDECRNMFNAALSKLPRYSVIGHGINLYLCKIIADCYKGKIYAQTDGEIYNKFTLELPLSQFSEAFSTSSLLTSY